MIAGSSLFLSMIYIKYVLFMSLWPRTIRIVISNWPRTRKFSQFFLKIQAGKTFSYHGHALVTLYVQFLCSDWSKFDRWVHAENSCSILKIVFSLWMYKLKYSCYQESSVYSWLVWLLVFWLRNASLVKFGNLILDGIVFAFHLT